MWSPCGIANVPSDPLHASRRSVLVAMCTAIFCAYVVNIRSPASPSLLASRKTPSSQKASGSPRMRPVAPRGASFARVPARCGMRRFNATLHNAAPKPRASRLRSILVAVRSRHRKARSSAPPLDDPHWSPTGAQQTDLPKPFPHHRWRLWYHPLGNRGESSTHFCQFVTGHQRRYGTRN